MTPDIVGPQCRVVCSSWKYISVAVYYLRRLPIESRVYMADGLPILIEFDSASTAAEV